MPGLALALDGFRVTHAQRCITRLVSHGCRFQSRAPRRRLTTGQMHAQSACAFRLRLVNGATSVAPQMLTCSKKSGGRFFIKTLLFQVDKVILALDEFQGLSGDLDWIYTYYTIIDIARTLVQTSLS
ncbi:hypothetical protein [Devosia sp.]|uniref:hypothetical protein n=1 Tax=Devosia sp. TaxID=1871048 RepID=UPI00262E8D36|nr:hypothetical protein [Devosia sp.]